MGEKKKIHRWMDHEYRSFIALRAKKFACAAVGAKDDNIAPKKKAQNTCGVRPNTCCNSPFPIKYNPEGLYNQIQGSADWKDCSNNNPLVQDWFVQNPMGL